MIPEIYKPASDRYDVGMKYRRSGKSGILLSEISLGFWHNFGSVDPLQRSIDIVHYAFDHGITHYDLANNYGPVYGSAEEAFGYIMNKSMHAHRHEMFIASKAGYDMWPGPYGNWGSRKYLFTSLEQSLKRMNLDYVDVFYSHRYDPETPLDETLQALVDIVRQGKSLYVGISRWPLAAAKYAFEYLRSHDVPCLLYQGRYNIFDRAPQTEGILDLVEEQGVGFVSFSPLAQGLLTNRYINGIPADSRMAKGGHLKSDMLSEERLQQIKELNEVAESRGETLAEMALTWVLSDKRITSVIVGASSVEQLANNLKTVTAPLLCEEELALINRITL